MEALRALLSGRLNPLEHVPSTEEYRDAAHRLSEAAQALQEAMTPEQRELLNAYKDACAVESCLVQGHLLLFGVRLGAAIQKELQDETCLLDFG